MTPIDIKTPRIEVMNDHFIKYHIEEPGVYRINDTFYDMTIPGVVHHFTAADGVYSDPHDHPWPFMSVILSGGYREEVFDLETGRSTLFIRAPLDTFKIEAGHIHRIVTLLAPECWTFIIHDQPERKSGFYQFRDGGAYHRLWDQEEWTRVRDY